ncbi:photosystem I assembly protein Ycf3 [bacterium BMS3Abin12]|nr:photosystem I assembly protein Ycf3 [bacterium BMS3Abin12]
MARTGDRAGAKAALDTIVQDYPGNPMGYQGLAGLYAAQGRVDDALKEYDRALKVAPKNPALLQQKAAVLAHQKKFAQAAAVLNRITADYPKSPLGYFRRGELYFAQKDYAKARAQFEEALKRAGKDVAKPLQAIVRTYLVEKRPGSAVKRVRAFLKDHPDNAYAYDLLGNLYRARADYANAESALRKASSLNPSWGKPYLDLSKVQLAQKRPAKAIAALQAGLKKRPAQLQLLFPLASLYQGSGDADAAAATYRKVLGVSPKNVLATNNLAMLLATRTDDPKAMKEAVGLAKELAKLRNPAIQDTVGWVYYRSGDAAKAVSVLESVVKAAPKVPIFQYHLGMALYKAGKTQAAKAHLERAVAKGAKYPGVAEARKVLAGLK